MKTIKEINKAGNNITILFTDGCQFSHAVTSEELAAVQGGDRDSIENIIAKYQYRDRHSVVGVYRYLNNKNEICSSPDGYSCGQCKFFRQTHVAYSEISIGTPVPNSWPYPVGVCQKHGFGPRLSAYKAASGTGCGWEIADWCKLDDRKLTKDEERELRELWK